MPRVRRMDGIYQTAVLTGGVSVVHPNWGWDEKHAVFEIVVC